VLRKQRLEDHYPSDGKGGTHVVGYETVVVQDVDSLETVAIVKFTPFHMMRESGEYDTIEALTMQLVSISKTSRKIDTNGAHKGGTGDMWATGWRAGSDANYSVGLYVPNPRTQRTLPSIDRWVENQAASRWMSDLYRSRFENLSKHLFDLTVQEASTSEIPDFGDAEFDDTKVEPFARNLTFTMNDFSNTFHTDRDYNSYAYGIWAPLVKDSGRLAPSAQEFECNGGEFVISSYNICVDFGACDGITEIIWRSNLDYHKTFPSSTKTGFTRLDSSAQISNELVHRIKLIQESKRGGVEKRTRGLQNILMDYKYSKFQCGSPNGEGSHSG
jgi:hypothetical protein